jgi:Tfp pilus assembly protein PilN
MRPVNLIPQDQRSDRGSRTGPLGYVIVAGLLALLAGVVVLVLTSNQISDREAEIGKLTAQRTAAQTRAATLEPFVKFQEVQQERTRTVAALADSRFDWPRVIRELSLVIPKYVVLTRLSGSAGGGGAASGSGEEAGLGSSVKGPSLQLDGCAKSQDRVAALIAALKQIDGVTRVGLSKSVRNTGKDGGSSGDSSGECLPLNAAFAVTVAFDAAPASPDGDAAVAVEPAAAPEEASETESSSSEDGEGSSETTTESEGSGETTVSKTTTVTPPE